MVSLTDTEQYLFIMIGDEKLHNITVEANNSLEEYICSIENDHHRAHIVAMYIRESLCVERGSVLEAINDTTNNIVKSYKHILDKEMNEGWIIEITDNGMEVSNHSNSDYIDPIHPAVLCVKVDYDADELRELLKELEIKKIRRLVMFKGYYIPQDNDLMWVTMLPSGEISESSSNNLAIAGAAIISLGAIGAGFMKI